MKTPLSCLKLKSRGAVLSCGFDGCARQNVHLNDIFRLIIIKVANVC